MPQWTVLVNRAAGARSTDPAAVRDALTAAGVDSVVRAPQGLDAMQHAIGEALAEGAEHLAVAGGDGTVNLTTNTILAQRPTAPPLLGVLPIGTGCDLLRTFGLPQELGAAARHLTTDDEYPIDICTLDGSWGRRYFVNVAQTGVGAAAAETAPRLSRKLGTLRYPLAFAWRLARFPRSLVTIETERRTYETEALAVIFANAQFFAGGWNIAPKATLIDGVMDIQIFEASKKQAPSLVPKIIKGTHLRERSVRRTVAARFTVDSQSSWPVEADGDYVGNGPVSGEVVSAALRLKI